MGHTEERLERVERLLLGAIQHQGADPETAEQRREVYARDVVALTQTVLGQAPQPTED